MENCFAKIIWIAEFLNEGVFNRRSNHVWASGNPHMYFETKYLDRFSSNVVCLVLDGSTRCTMSVA